MAETWHTTSTPGADKERTLSDTPDASLGQKWAAFSPKTAFDHPKISQKHHFYGQNRQFFGPRMSWESLTLFFASTAIKAHLVCQISSSLKIKNL